MRNAKVSRVPPRMEHAVYQTYAKCFVAISQVQFLIFDVIVITVIQKLSDNTVSNIYIIISCVICMYSYGGEDHRMPIHPGR